ncbi:MAG: M12 family metallo-peptidase [Pseudomonadales bacterium]|nr:M12 family metallo-peptidase [Pseudomonadales bacterium]
MIKIQPQYKKRFTKPWLIICLILLGPASSLVFAESDWIIGYAEQAQIFSQVQPNGTNNKDHMMVITVAAFNRHFELQLKTNDHLTDKNSHLSIPKDIILYAGVVKDKPNSWVRLTYYNDIYVGAIYDGSELFMMDSSTNVAKALSQTLHSSGAGPVIYKASDISSSMSCGLSEHSAKKFSYKTFVNDLQKSVLGKSQTISALASSSLEQIKVDIVADTEYSREVSGDSTTAILSQMNVVDGIFTEQVGVTISINSIDVLSNNGSLTSRNSESLLESFRDYAGRSHPGLAHLFTGKDLDGGSTLGIAYLDAICSNWGVGVSRAGGRGVGGALTVAHEFGHNFGAPHDNQGGSACSYESNRYLMNPYYNQSDEFSQCSISQMNNMINGASCIVEIDDGGPGGGNNDALTTTKENYTLGETVVIDYHDGSGSSLDWIGIFRQGDLTSSCRQNDSYVDWVYTNGRSGTESFSGLEVGNYEAQLFSDDGYCYIGDPVMFTVSNENNDDNDVPDSDLPYKGFKDHQGLCLTVDKSRSPMRTKVSPCSFGLLDNSQRWRLTESGYLQSLSTGLCLTPGSSQTSQYVPFLAECTVESWFAWTHQNGVIVNSHRPNYALTSPNTSGAIVSLSTQNGSVRQQWEFGGALGSSILGLVVLMCARIRRRKE